MFPILLSAAGTVEVVGEEVPINMEAIWTSITSVVGKFIEGVLTPVATFVTSNPISLIFLGVSFIGIGIRYMKRVTYAFGRGR